MSKKVKEPLNHVVTFRITTEEKEILEELIAMQRTSVSTLMRALLIKSLDTSSPSIASKNCNW